MGITKLFLLLFVGGFLTASIHAQVNRPRPTSTQTNGRVELRVWDRGAKQFIYAGLDIYPKKVQRKKFYAMSTATGDDGSSNTVTLQPGTYLAKVARYLCRGKNYFAASPPSFWLLIRADRLTRKTLTVDVSKMRAKRSYDNLDGKTCSK